MALVAGMRRRSTDIDSPSIRLQNHWPFPSYHIGLGYAYCFTHPGVPSIFWPHMYGGNDKLKKLILDLIKVGGSDPRSDNRHSAHFCCAYSDGALQLRRRNNIRSDSRIEIKCAEHDMYVATIDDRVTIKCGPR